MLPPALPLVLVLPEALLWQLLELALLEGFIGGSAGPAASPCTLSQCGASISLALIPLVIIGGSLQRLRDDDRVEGRDEA